MAILAQDLKNAVLQYALQGKLTEQLDSDSSVEELLSKIKTEKEQLIKDKKIKKEKYASEKTEDFPFEIPENWKWCNFGEIAYLKMGKTPPKADPKYWGTDYTWLQIADVLPNQRVSSSKESISQFGFEEKFKGEISPAETLIMSFKLTIGRVAILDKPCLHNEAIISIFPYINTDYIFRDYLFTFLPFIAPRFGISKNAIKGNTLNSESLYFLPIPVPPIEEQTRIVAKVEEIMSKIDEYEKIENQLESIKKAFPMDMRDALLQAAMQGKLTKQLDSDSSVDDLIESIKVEREKLVTEGKIKKSKGKSTQPNVNFVELEEDDKPFEIPTNWKFINLSSVSYTNGGYAFKSSDYTKEGIRVIRISDFNNNGILNEEIVKYPYNEALEPFKIKENDILMCMTGGTVGKCCIVKNITEYMATNQRVANISSLGINADFLYFAIKSPFIQKIIQNNKTSTNDNISMDLILSFPIPLPPLEEQERIVKVLNDLLPLCEAL